jgi:hypothetical protein
VRHDYMAAMLKTLLLIAVVAQVSAPSTATAQTCKSFKTCEEAMKSYRAGNTKLDGDKDGIPCESLCGGNSSKSKN